MIPEGYQDEDALLQMKWSPEDSSQHRHWLPLKKQIGVFE